MKYTIATAATLISTAAFAGGYTPPAAEPPINAPIAPAVPVEPDSDWSGGYIGLQYGKGKLDLSFPAFKYGNLDFPNKSTDVDADAYGVHAGYLHDFGKFIIGAELDHNKFSSDEYKISHEDSKGNTATGVGQLEDSLSRLRGRAGYDAGKWLPYVTLGIAHIPGDNAISYGAGVDFKVTEKFTVGAEYTRQSFDLPLSDFVTSPTLAEVKADLDLIQIRGAYHF